LVGQIMVVARYRIKFEETEPNLVLADPAAHSFHGKKTGRVSVMYSEGGHSYVYLIYGMYYCFNIVTQEAGRPEAVLIRALEPLEKDLPKIKKLRKTKKDIDLLNGPGKLCTTLRITKEHNGLDLTKRTSWIKIEEGSSLPKRQIVSTTRIGVDYSGEAAEWPLRFYDSKSLWVSRR
jgi:DNA-3-methyladenine glycosylase